MMEDLWVAWPGGDCPVSRTTEVTIRKRNGEEFSDITGFGPHSLDWQHRDSEHDIIAFHISATRATN